LQARVSKLKKRKSENCIRREREEQRIKKEFHNNLARKIANALKEKRFVDPSTIEVLKEYHNNGKEGDVDVLAMNYSGDYYFIEVKSGGGHYKDALEQYQRYCEAFPNRNVRGLYITPNNFKRFPRS